MLQCRRQSHGAIRNPAEIPMDLDPEKVLFTANKYVTNGMMNNITHIVYVDPEKYNEVSRQTDLKLVGEAIGRLNKILPKDSSF